MASKIKVDTIENVAGSGNVSLGSGHNLVVPGNITGQGTAAITSNATVGGTLAVTGDATFDTNTLKVDAANNRVAIGHTSPGTKVDIRDSGYVGLGVGSTNAGGAAIFLDGDSNGDFSGSDYSYILHDTAGRLDIIQDSPSGTNQIRLFTEGTTERMRVSSNILIGTTNNSPGEGTSAGIRLGTNGASQFSAGNQCLDLNRTSNNGDVVVFRRGGTVCGEIVVNGDNQTTAYQTSSDYRLKENVTYDFDATARLKQLKPARFNFISNPNDTTVDGFLAHEVSSIVPEAVGGEKDATKILSNVVLNSDGTVNSSEIDEKDWIAGKEDKIYASNTTWVVSKTVPSYQGIDQSKLVPLLVKTIQELEARIAALEAE